MHFYLKHAVGNRERWKTDDTLSHASAVIIANEVAAIPGVTGLVVNPRIGSVTLTVADAAAKARTLAYFESLASIRRFCALTVQSLQLKILKPQNGAVKWRFSRCAGKICRRASYRAPFMKLSAASQQCRYSMSSHGCGTFSGRFSRDSL